MSASTATTTAKSPKDAQLRAPGERTTFVASQALSPRPTPYPTISAASHQMTDDGTAGRPVPPSSRSRTAAPLVPRVWVRYSQAPATKAATATQSIAMATPRDSGRGPSGGRPPPRSVAPDPAALASSPTIARLRELDIRRRDPPRQAPHRQRPPPRRDAAATGPRRYGVPSGQPIRRVLLRCRISPARASGTLGTVGEPGEGGRGVSGVAGDDLLQPLGRPDGLQAGPGEGRLGEHLRGQERIGERLGEGVVSHHRGQQRAHHLVLGVVLGPDADVPLEVVDVPVQLGQPLLDVDVAGEVREVLLRLQPEPLPVGVVGLH